MRRALAIDEQELRPRPPQRRHSASTTSRQLLQDTNRLAEAEPLMRRALAIDEKSYGNDHPDVAVRLNNLAQLLKATNRLAEAEPLMRRALRISEQSFGLDHPTVATRLNNLGQLLQATVRPAEAEPLMRRAVEILVASTRATGNTHPRLQKYTDNYRGLLRAMGRSEERILATLREMAPELF